MSYVKNVTPDIVKHASNFIAFKVVLLHRLSFRGVRAGVTAIVCQLSKAH